MKALSLATALATVSLPTAGLAHDHLFNGATAAGADARGFANPVADNPSGVSGAASDPGTVPGLGNPNAGRSTGTPSFDPVSLENRLQGRTGN